MDRSPQQRDEARKTVENNVYLTVESFGRLMSLLLKALQARTGQGQPGLTGGEREEVYSILARAGKRRLFKIWREEEDSLDIQLGPEEFWKAFKEPVPGAWSPGGIDGDCLVDPDRISREDLPVPDLDSPVVSLWQERRLWLDQKQDELRSKREAEGDKGSIPCP